MRPEQNPTEIDPDQHRILIRLNRKMTERTNRIRKLTPGRGRIYELDRIALELEAEADERETRHVRLGHALARCGCDSNRPQDLTCEAADGLRLDALYLRRLAWDLGELRDAVRPSTAARRASTVKGPRP